MLCTKCKKDKELKEFYSYSRRCKQCLNEYRNQYRKTEGGRIAAKKRYIKRVNNNKYKENRIRDYIKKKEDNLKILLEYLGRKKIICEKCGYNKSLAAIECHHIDPSQKNGKHDTLSGWLTRLSPSQFQDKIKITAFMFLCANCHAEYHAGLWKNI